MSHFIIVLGSPYAGVDVGVLGADGGGVALLSGADGWRQARAAAPWRSGRPGGARRREVRHVAAAPASSRALKRDEGAYPSLRARRLATHTQYSSRLRSGCQWIAVPHTPAISDRPLEPERL